MKLFRREPERPVRPLDPLPAEGDPAAAFDPDLILKADVEERLRRAEWELAQLRGTHATLLERLRARAEVTA